VISPHLAVFLLSLAGSLALTPLAIRLGKRQGLVARPGGRRQHDGPVPVTGSLVIAVSFVLGSILAWTMLPPTGGDIQLLRGVMLGALVIFLGGLFDDRLELSHRWLFVIQIAAAGIAIGHEVFIERFTNPITSEEVVIEQFLIYGLLTLFWMLGMVNTVNFMDGLDGLAVGVGVVAALMFAWHSYNLEQFSVSLFPLALAGALLGFLPFNFAPARIFLGSGAYLLGFLLAGFSILAPAKIATALLVMAVPIWDIAWQIYSRLRHGRSPFHGDRNHLHFRLADAGVPTRAIVLAYYAISAAFGLVAIFAPGVMKLVALSLLTLLLLGVFAWMTRLEVR